MATGSPPVDTFQEAKKAPTGRTEHQGYSASGHQTDPRSGRSRFAPGCHALARATGTHWQDQAPLVLGKWTPDGPKKWVSKARPRFPPSTQARKEALTGPHSFVCGKEQRGIGGCTNLKFFFERDLSVFFKTELNPHVHRCIGYRKLHWQSLTKSERLTYLGVYDSRDDASESAPSPSSPSSLTHVHRCIVYHNPNWQSLTKSKRLTY